MKILVVCQRYYPEQFRITDICEELVKMGHEVTVLTGLPNYPEGVVPEEYRHGKNRRQEINGVRVVRCFERGRGGSKLGLFLNYYSFVLSSVCKALFYKGEFDVILANQLSPVMMVYPALVLKRRFHKKLLLYCMDLWPDSLAAGGVRRGSLLYRFYRWVSRRIYRKADKILTTSDQFISYFHEILQIQNKPIEHLPQYAEDIFCVGDKREKTQKTGCDLVFAGNVGKMQSVQTIVRAAALLKGRCEVRWHIVGDGSALEECRQLAGQLELGDTLTFYGRRPVEEMPEFYALADAMLITLADNEMIARTLPGKMQSYLAAGKPVLGAIGGETRQVIEQSGCGLCCEPEDADGLALLAKAFCQSGEREQMAQKARRFYEEHYRKDLFLERLEDELEKLAKE